MLVVQSDMMEGTNHRLHHAKYILDKKRTEFLDSIIRSSSPPTTDKSIKIVCEMFVSFDFVDSMPRHTVCDSLAKE